MPLRWLAHAAGMMKARSGTTERECQALEKYAAGKKVLVEIGTDEGATARGLRQAMDPEGVLYLVDPYKTGRIGVNFSLLIARRELSKNRNGRVVFVRQYSHDAAATLEDVAAEFTFIDGDHSYEAARRDWYDWSRKIVPGGVVALHDSGLFEGGWTAPEWGPVRLANELRDGEHQTHDRRFEFVESADSITFFRRL